MTGEKKSKSKQDESNPEFGNFQRLLKDVLLTPKEQLDKRRDEYERAKGRRKQDKD